MADRNAGGVIAGNTVILQMGQDGSVWQAEDDFMPGRCPDAEAVFDEFLPRVSRVRILGSRRNAGLIVAAYARCRERGIRLEVASPAVHQAADATHTPEVILHRAKSIGLAPSMGGWHTFTGADLPSYQLAIHRGDEVETTPAATILESHPAWRALSFIPMLRLQSCCRILGDILDPRWFVDPDHPDRLTKLESFLGLTPRIQNMVDAGRRPSANYDQRAYDRCLDVRSAWCRQLGQSAALEPSMFLSRTFIRYPLGKGFLRASQLFVRFLYGVWLQGLYAGTPHGPRLFAPSLFFSTPAEVKSFELHMRRV